CAKDNTGWQLLNLW
nr:immunoglobulin heavy chain junction region [Macaca mulatta]